MENGALEQRLSELRAELARGQAHLAQLDQQRRDTRDTLLRISGAIQVLEELLAAQPAAPAVARNNGHECARGVTALPGAGS